MLIVIIHYLFKMIQNTTSCKNYHMFILITWIHNKLLWWLILDCQPYYCNKDLRLWCTHLCVNLWGSFQKGLTERGKTHFVLWVAPWTKSKWKKEESCELDSLFFASCSRQHVPAMSHWVMPSQQRWTVSPKYDTTGSQEREKVTNTVPKSAFQRNCIRNMKNMWWWMLLIPELGRQWQVDLCDLEASLVYRVTG